MAQVLKCYGAKFVTEHFTETPKVKSLERNWQDSIGVYNIFVVI